MRATPAILRRILLPAALLAALPAMALEVIRDNQVYIVRGDTAEEIRASLDKLGPLDSATGQPYDARTTWSLEWRFDSRSSWQGCEIARVWTQLKVTMLMPRHGSASTLPEPLRKDWARYQQRLALYEEGHVRIPSDAARELEIALDRLHRSDCASLEKEANRLGQEAIQKARATERAYEIQTSQGRTLGARFPWTETATEDLSDAEQSKLPDRIAR